MELRLARYPYRLAEGYREVDPVCVVHLVAYLARTVNDILHLAHLILVHREQFCSLLLKVTFYRMLGYVRPEYAHRLLPRIGQQARVVRPKFVYGLLERRVEKIIEMGSGVTGGAKTQVPCLQQKAVRPLELEPMGCRCTRDSTPMMTTSYLRSALNTVPFLLISACHMLLRARSLNITFIF